MPTDPTSSRTIDQAIDQATDQVVAQVVVPLRDDRGRIRGVLERGAVGSMRRDQSSRAE